MRNILFLLLLFLFQLPAKAKPCPDGIDPADSSKTVALFEAIRSGNPGQLESLLKQGANPNDTLDGYSALMAAAMSGTTGQMKILLAAGADPYYKNADSLTALWLSVPDIDKTILMLDHGADPNMPAKGGATILNKLASISGSSALIQLLIAKGIDAKKNNKENSLIFRSALSGDTANLAIFIHLGLNVNDTNRFGGRPLLSASSAHCFLTIKMLVENGADTKIKSRKYGMTPLMLAARAGDDETIVYLLEHGADAKAVDNIGYTALTYLGLSETDRPDITQSLYDELGVKAFNKAPDGADAYYYAGKKGPTRSAQLLIKYMNQK